MQTGTTVWLKERDWDTGQTSLDEPGSHAGVEQCHKQYGDGGEGDCEAEGVPASGSLPRRGGGGSVTDVKQLACRLREDPDPTEHKLIIGDMTATNGEAIN